MEAQHFLLVGNAPYSNRGCEAIVRGTMRILRRTFGDDIRVTLASHGSPSLIARQAAAETDPAITHICLAGGRWTGTWFSQKINRLARRTVLPTFPKLNPALRTAVVALEVGGDNYSLDYGWPKYFIEMDRYIRHQHVPVVIWGASVGPFDADPERAPLMFKHLASLEGIFARESATRAYLAQHAIASVIPVCDPAFAMEAQMPAAEQIGFALPDAPVGLNFSPLMAKYVTGGDMSVWVTLCADIVTRTADALRRPILFIPHVTAHRADEDDLVLLQGVYERLGRVRAQVQCLPGTLSAAETKGVIARCSVFAGARTHATIAALSSGVPTLSFAYSLKAQGLNQDLFNSLDYCILPQELQHADAVAARIAGACKDRARITQHLQSVIPAVIDRAFAAGPALQTLLASRGARVKALV